MQLKSFTANDMADAIKLIRYELGDDAVIVSTTELPEGVKVMAAGSANENNQNVSLQSTLKIIQKARDIASFHRFPADLTEAWVDVVTQMGPEILLDLEQALDSFIRFDREWLMRANSKRPIMFVGGPGSGKTLSIAKLAATYLSGDQDVQVVSTDFVKAGGCEQLARYLDAMDQSLHLAKTPEMLGEILEKNSKITLIDMPAMNPLDSEDRDTLQQWLNVGEFDVVWVLSANMDALDAAQWGEVFKELGACHILVTGLDMVHRLGGVTNAAFQTDLPLVGMSSSPNLGDGLWPLNSQEWLKELLEKVVL